MSKEITIEDVLKKQAEERYPDNHANSILGNNVKQMRRCFIEGATYAASLNRQGWTRVEDGLPDYDELVIVYGQRKLSQPSMGGNPDAVMVGQRMNIKGTGIEKQRERYVDKNEFRQMNYVTHWMPLPNKPI